MKDFFLSLIDMHLWGSNMFWSRLKHSYVLSWHGANIRDRATQHVPRGHFRRKLTKYKKKNVYQPHENGFLAPEAGWHKSLPSRNIKIALLVPQKSVKTHSCIVIRCQEIKTQSWRCVHTYMHAHSHRHSMWPSLVHSFAPELMSFPHDHQKLVDGKIFTRWKHYLTQMPRKPLRCPLHNSLRTLP